MLDELLKVLSKAKRNERQVCELANALQDLTTNINRVGIKDDRLLISQAKAMRVLNKYFEEESSHRDD